jgi:hypothetical protein
MEQSETPVMWGILELMGHVRTAGRITEEEKFGCKLGRIDIPKDDGFVTQYFGGSSIYRLSPCTEEVARAVAKTSVPSPVHSWELPKQITTVVSSVDHDDDDFPMYDDDK